MRTATILPCLLLTLFAAGCGGGDRPTSTATQASAAPATATAAPSTEPYTEGGSLQPFYGEVFHEGRYYLFGTKLALNKFLAAREPDPLKIKSFIGKGPNRTTIVAQTDKDVPAMTMRLVNQLRKRHNLPPLG